MTHDELEAALAALARGGVVAAATETFFGLLADVRRPEAVETLFELKGRAEQKGVALLVPGQRAWESLVTDVPSVARRLADHFWPGPLTIALAARADLDPRITMNGTVAVRRPGPSDAARITDAWGGPLTATSANRAGEAPSSSSAKVAAVFREALASGRLMVVPGLAPGGEASTVVLVTNGGIQMVRCGRIQESELLAAVPATVARKM